LIETLNPKVIPASLLKVPARAFKITEVGIGIRLLHRPHLHARSARGCHSCRHSSLLHCCWWMMQGAILSQVVHWASNETTSYSMGCFVLAPYIYFIHIVSNMLKGEYLG
jgi:hypothetical protein